MEKNNEKDIRTYERPEADIMVFNFDRICQGTEDGVSGGEDEWDEEDE